MTNSIRLSILMPCLNESKTLLRCIVQAQKYLSSHKINGEIIIADNGSTDGSPKIAINAGARVVNVIEKGYGNALMGGILAAKGEYVVMGDADESYDFSALQPFIDALDQGYDLVIGNRFKGGISPGAMPFLHRYLGNPVLSWLGRLFFRVKIRDFHCGLRAFRRSSILRLELRTTGMEFASEMVVKSAMLGLKITEVPTHLYPDGRDRPPHLRTWSDGWRHLRFLLLYSPRWLFFYPGIAIMAVGLGVTLWLLPGPRKVGSVVLDINTLLYSATMIILGLQLVFFFLFARVFGVETGFLPSKAVSIKAAIVDRGIAIGMAGLLLGLASSIGAILYWEQKGFGNIDPSFSMRLVIPGAVLFACGFQILVSSFFLGILMIRRK